MKNKILIVDDDTESCILQQAVTQRMGFYTQLAVNGIEAINVIKEDQPDMVLLDIFMPQMDGFETAKLIHDKFNIPIIIITAGGNQSINKIKEMQLGITHFVQKPINPTLLQHEIVKCVNEIKQRKINKL